MGDKLLTEVTVAFRNFVNVPKNSNTQKHTNV
jgi:hypothetical protein